MILRRHRNGSFYFGKCVARNVGYRGQIQTYCGDSSEQTHARKVLCTVTRIPRTRLGLETTLFTRRAQDSMRRFRTRSCRKKVGGYKIFCPRPERTSPTPSRAVRSCSSIAGLIFDYVETNSPGCSCRHAHPVRRSRFLFLSLRKWEAMPAARCANPKENIRRGGARRRGRRRGHL